MRRLQRRFPTDGSEIEMCFAGKGTDFTTISLLYRKRELLVKEKYAIIKRCVLKNIKRKEK